MINWRLMIFKYVPMWVYQVLFMLLILLLASVWISAQENEFDQARCYERPLHIEQPRSYPYLWCLELIFQDTSSPTLSFSALTVSDDGTLYATRPLYGELFAFDDTNGDGLPDSPRLIADGLTLPNGLDWHDGMLYVSGGKNIYRVNPDDGQVDVLVDDLPFEGGLWTGDVIVAPDDRLYVGTSALCDDCLPDHPKQGAILSFDLDGDDPQIMAQGFRQPQGLAWIDDALWVTDTAPRSFLSATETESGWLDEINRIETGEHYGFPYCVGDNRPYVESSEFDCDDSILPAIQLPTQSNPVAVILYEVDTLPFNEQLLVALGGSSQAVDVRGHQIIALTVDEAWQPTQIEIVVPYKATGNTIRRIVPYQPGTRPFDIQIQNQINDDGDGIWPHFVLDMTLNPEGWLYISMSDGTIVVIRD